MKSIILKSFIYLISYFLPFSSPQKTLSFGLFFKNFLFPFLDLNGTLSFDEILMIENVPLSFQQKSDSLLLENITLGSQALNVSFSFWVRPLINTSSNAFLGTVCAEYANVTSYMYAQNNLIQTSAGNVSVYTDFATGLVNPIIMDWASFNAGWVIFFLFILKFIKALCFIGIR